MGAFCEDALAMIEPDTMGEYLYESFETNECANFSLHGQAPRNTAGLSNHHNYAMNPLLAPSPPFSSHLGTRRVSSHQALFLPSMQHYASHQLYSHIPAPNATPYPAIYAKPAPDRTAFVAPHALPPATEPLKKTLKSVKMIQGGRCMASHSFVEKQRRDRINSLIDEIREIVPSSVSHSQRPKHAVLEDALEFIRAVIQGNSSSRGSDDMTGGRGSGFSMQGILQGSPMSSNQMSMAMEAPPRFF